MRISKDLAKEVAKKLLQGKQDLLDAKNLKLKNLAYDRTVSTIRDDIKEAYSKFPKFFNTSDFVAILCKENHDDPVEIKLPKPVPSEGYWKVYVYVYVSKEEYKSFEAMADEIKVKADEIFDAKKIISNTIFGLRTALQVQKHFPEAYEFLPKESSGNTLPMLNLDHVRSLIK